LGAASYAEPMISVQRHHLKPHPSAPPGRVSAVVVELLVDPGDDINLTYTVTDAEDVIVPTWVSPKRRNGLWRSTCFELFLKPKGGRAYFEYNFSPSSEWDSFQFDDRRFGMRPLIQPVDPAVYRGTETPHLVVEAEVDLSGLPNVPMSMGVSAVIEEKGGRMSYWALAHAAGDADFHHDDCFALELPAATAA